jgi:hypothetical protein
MNPFFHHTDVTNKIVEYLPFEDKIQFGRYCRRNYTKFYDFTKISNEEDISDVFYSVYGDDVFDYVQDARFMYIDLDDEYYEYRKESYFYEEYEEINDEYKERRREENSRDSDNGDESDEDSDITDITFDQYSFTSRDLDNLRQEFKDTLDNTFHSVYARCFIETIENYDLDIPDGTELDEHFPVSVLDEVIDYYRAVLKSDVDINVFCYRCGKFGHHKTSKSCIFYSMKYENKVIKREVRDVLRTITNDIVKGHEQELKRRMREPLLCVLCKVNNKKMKCVYECCGGCCRKDDCKIHRR